MSLSCPQSTRFSKKDDLSGYFLASRNMHWIPVSSGFTMRHLLAYVYHDIDICHPVIVLALLTRALLGGCSNASLKFFS